MSDKLYKRFVGIDETGSQINAEQVSFLELNNFIVSQVQNAITKRGGSVLTGARTGDYWGTGYWGTGYWSSLYWATTSSTTEGDDWGIGSYIQKTTDPKMPVYAIPVRHRRDDTTSYIEKYDWSGASWSAITQGAYTSFSAGDIASFAQIEDMLCVFAGRPSKITDITSGSITRLGGPAPTTAPTVAASVGAGGLDGEFRWILTFYDEDTGWESSPSPITDTLVLSAKNASFTGLPTTCDKEGVTHKRLYRTNQVGEEPFLFVAEIPLANTTVTDDVLDDDRGPVAPFYGGDDGLEYFAYDHNPPPSLSYLASTHQARVWVADGTELYYSLPYVGDVTNLEYFSPERVLSFPFRITGLAPLPSGTMLVFTPPGFGVWEVIGRDETTFARRLVVPDEGTNFHASVCSHGNQVAYWGRTGPALIQDGTLAPEFGEGIKERIRDRLLDQADVRAFAWTVWHDEIGFIFGFGTVDNEGIHWYDATNFQTVTWVDSITNEPIIWEEAP